MDTQTSTGHHSHAIALCAGCAKEVVGEKEPVLVNQPDFDGACQRCGMQLAGFFYVASEDAGGGMLPGPG